MSDQSRCARLSAEIIRNQQREIERLTEQLKQCQAALAYAELRLAKIEKEKA
jgi:uncharacterized protein (DUF305 family)